MSRKKEKQDAANNDKALHKEKVPLKLYLGAKIEALEDNNLWYPAKIIGIEESNQRILVHFSGFNSRYDKWYDGQGDSIRPLTDNRDKMESTDKDGQQSEVNTSLVQSLLNAPNQPKNVIFSKEEFDETSKEENHQQESQLDLIQAADGCLTGLSFHFSGNPRNFSIKSQLKTFIKRYNGVYHSYFNKYTKCLIAGYHPKRKVLNEAKRWSTPVVDEDSFFDLVKQSNGQISFSQQFSMSSGYDDSRLELSATIKTEVMDSPGESDIPRDSKSVQRRSPTKTGRIPKTTARRKRRKVIAKDASTNRGNIGESDRSGNPDEVVDDCHIPLTPCEAPTNNFETSLGGTSLANASSSTARTGLSPGSGVKRRSKAPAVMTEYVLPRKKRKSSQTDKSAATDQPEMSGGRKLSQAVKSAANSQLEMSGGKRNPTSLIITTDLTERRIISSETVLKGERPKLTLHKRKYVRKAASQRSSMVNDEGDVPEVVSRKIVQNGEDVRVECVFQEEARTQCPVENAGEIEDSLTNPRGNKDASNGHTTLSRALSASSGFHSDESSNGNQNSRQNIRRPPDIEAEVSYDSRRMIDSMPDRITAENSERICELEQQSFSEAQSSRSSQNNRVSERSDSMEFDSAGINQTACENNSHQVDINHKSPFVSTPPLSFSPGRSFSITERNVQTNTPTSERHPSYVQCPEHCGIILGTEQVESHLKLNCVNAEAECDICGFKMLRKDLQDHITRNAAKHISLMAAEMQAVKNVNKTIIADNVKLRQKLNDMLTKVAFLEERCKAQELLDGQ